VVQKLEASNLLGEEEEEEEEKELII